MVHIICHNSDYEIKRVVATRGSSPCDQPNASIQLAHDLRFVRHHCSPLYIRTSFRSHTPYTMLRLFHCSCVLAHSMHGAGIIHQNNSLCPPQSTTRSIVNRHSALLRGVSSKPFDGSKETADNSPLAFVDDASLNASESRRDSVTPSVG